MADDLATMPFVRKVQFSMGGGRCVKGRILAAAIRASSNDSVHNSFAMTVAFIFITSLTAELRGLVDQTDLVGQGQRYASTQLIQV